MSDCKKLTLKKYIDRPSPPYHANDCKDKTIKGNDGKLYKSVPDKRKVYTWKLVETNTTRKSKGAKRYVITDNGSKPWLVEDYPKEKRAIIYRNHGDNLDKIVNPIKVTEMKYMALWPSSSDSKKFGDWEKGNTVLIQKSKETFVLVYREITEFKIEGDEAVKFMSPIGNNDVPYPYLIGKLNVYFLVDIGSVTSVPIDKLDLTQDVYSQLWGINEFDGKGLKDLAKPIKDKIIFSR
jgi:hypothetical protein